MNRRGFLRNCIIVPRKDETAETLFLLDTENDTVHCYLDGYAIIPRDEYEALVGPIVPIKAQLLPNSGPTEPPLSSAST